MHLYFHCYLDVSAGYWLQLLSLGPMYLLPQKDNILQNIANPQWQNFSNNKLQLLFYKIIAIGDTLKKNTYNCHVRKSTKLSLYNLSFKGTTGNRSEDWEGMETDFAGRSSKGERYCISSQKWDPTDHYS